MLLVSSRKPLVLLSDEVKTALAAIAVIFFFSPLPLYCFLGYRYALLCQFVLI